MKRSLLYLIFLSIISCSSVTETRYKKAYEVISKDISSVLIYDSIYANPIKDNNFYNGIISEKKNERTKALRKDKILTKLSRKNLHPNWYLNANFNVVWGSIVQYDKENINGPMAVALFSEVKNNEQRIDIVPFFVGYPQYCGSIYKYYFKFHKTKIIKYKKWSNHYECW